MPNSRFQYRFVVYPGFKPGERRVERRDLVNGWISVIPTTERNSDFREIIRWNIPVTDRFSGDK